MERTLNKLDALNTVASAYRYVLGADGEDSSAAKFLEETFHQVRRSLQNIQDTLPKPAFNEGFNGRMPRYL